MDRESGQETLIKALIERELGLTAGIAYDVPDKTTEE